MLTKVPNANCFSRVIAFFGLIILFPICFTLSSQASSAADRDRQGERRPLLINEHREAPDRVEVDLEEGLDRRSLQQYLADLDINGNTRPLDPIVVAANLLEEQKSATAEAEMDKITTYMYYVSDTDYHEDIIREAKEGAYFVADTKHFEKLLLDRAFKAATEGPLTSYLPELNTIILDLQKFPPQYQQRIVELQRRVDYFDNAIKIIKRKEAEARAEQQRQLEELRKSNRRLWIAIPVVGVFAVVVGGGLATLFTHLYWH